MLRSTRSGLLIAFLGIALCTAGLTAAPAMGAAPGSRVQHDTTATALMAEAVAFMAGYAEDLLRGNRAALADRYDLDGVFELRPGRKYLTSHDALRSHYEDLWSPPVSFEWRDLSYEVVGPEAVLITGLFDWGGSGGSSVTQSYAALLRRGPGGLRIRMEAEAGQPQIPWLIAGIGLVLMILISAAIGWVVSSRRYLREQRRRSVVQRDRSS
jgi:hypothetical protein